MPKMPSTSFIFSTALLIISSSYPAICTKYLSSFGAFVIIFLVFSLSKARAFALIISQKVSSQPNCFAILLKGKSVYPANGANATTGLLKSICVFLFNACVLLTIYILQKAKNK